MQQIMLGLHLMLCSAQFGGSASAEKEVRSLNLFQPLGVLASMTVNTQNTLYSKTYCYLEKKLK